ncbi:hypothetical protein GCWU000341_01923 [Oribacterium sp. oral taxon 078 str. F0262]|nr:hypothetical protein GCWU000341_01923 [Oribacterium sp. oral taxon 078 str. F0262]
MKEVPPDRIKEGDPLRKERKRGGAKRLRLCCIIVSVFVGRRT